MKSVLILRITTALAAGLSLCACQTVSMPKFDLVKSPEFSEDAANIKKDYPRIKDAPLAPTDIRSDAQWDKDVRDLQSLRDTSSPIEDQLGLSEGEAETRFETLKAKAQAYKKDDPDGGPVQGFPDYEPRR